MISKVDWTLIYTLLAALVTNLIGLIVTVWKLSQWQTKLILKIDKNKDDINNLGNSIRKKIDRENYYQNVQISHIARYLEETTNYRHPTMGGFEDESSRNKR